MIVVSSVWGSQTFRTLSQSQVYFLQRLKRARNFVNFCAMTPAEVFEEIISMNSVLLEHEEPPMSFYADLVEEGLVEVRYNERGGLVVSQGTQHEEAWKPSLNGSGIMKGIVMLCGVLSLFTLHRISFGTIPCLCTAEEPCPCSGQSIWVRMVRYVFGMYGQIAPRS